MNIKIPYIYISERRNKYLCKCSTSNNEGGGDYLINLTSLRGVI